MKHTALAALSVGAVLLILGAGCGGQTATPAGDTNATQHGTPQPSDTSVTVPVTYDPHGLIPKEVTINVGDSVEFRNSDLKPHWPASNPHPTHTDYPGFDAKTGVTPGTVWDFKFTRAGDWKFHDHTNPKNTLFQGVVHVKAPATK